MKVSQKFLIKDKRMILQIDDTADEIYFPDPHYGDEDGCFAIGGDLSIDRLLLYSNGIFPGIVSVTSLKYSGSVR